MLLCIRGSRSIYEKKVSVVESKNTRLQSWTLIDFLQFQRYLLPQAESEEAFTYINHKPIDFSIDFSHRLKT